jgi:thiol:disulfide interchange protein DsbD
MSTGPAAVLRRLALALVMLAAAVPAALANPFQPAAEMRVRADLLSEVAEFRPGQPFDVALRLRMDPQWHTYWRNPGDSGLPTRIEWKLPPGFAIGEIQWPYPKRLPVGPLMNFGYEGEVLLIQRVTPPADWKPGAPALFAARADWLVCKDVCIPEGADLSLTVASAREARPDERQRAAFALTRGALPQPLGNAWQASAHRDGARVWLALRHVSGDAPEVASLAFFPLAEGVWAHAAPQPVLRHRDGYRIELTLAEPQPRELPRLDGVLVALPGLPVGAQLPALTGPALEIDAALAATAVDLGPALGLLGGAGEAPLGLYWALLFALAGGLILNLMPCVFPVLSLKVLGFMQYAGGNPRRARLHGLVFSAGIVLSFVALALLLLALRAGGEQLGWGFQLQSPGFIAAMAVLFTVLALNFAGVFETGLRIAAVAGEAELRAAGRGYGGSFAAGGLAVVVAAPCTAPFMGAALGYALAQPAAVALAVFAALGTGMALPYLLLAVAPRLLGLLPRPGAWMATFRQFMAFPLLATVVWLTWVLGLQSGMNAVLGLLSGLTLIAFAAWLYGRWAHAAGTRRVVALGASLAAVVAGLYVAWPGGQGGPGLAAPPGARDAATLDWQPWSRERVAELRAAGRPVFVDFTAAWCVTCQVNKQVVLESRAVAERFRALDVVMLQADWTRRDPEITRALAEFKRSGVPLYVLYGTDPAAPPMLLPEILTPEIVFQALAAAIPAARTAASR